MIYLLIYLFVGVVVSAICGYADVDDEVAFWLIVLWPAAIALGAICLPFYGSYVLGKLIAGRK